MFLAQRLKTTLKKLCYVQKRKKTTSLSMWISPKTVGCRTALVCAQVNAPGGGKRVLDRRGRVASRCLPGEKTAPWAAAAPVRINWKPGEGKKGDEAETTHHCVMWKGCEKTCTCKLKSIITSRWRGGPWVWRRLRQRSHDAGASGDD